MKKRTKISVGVITYNQESTIRQTLDSILMQKGDFDLEVVIGEDCSTDATHAICEEYARQWNNGERVVKLLSNTHNLGIFANAARVMQACTGKYIVGIAGDDYYCDNHALEKQMKYMESHPQIGVMFSNGYSYYIQRNIKVPGLNIPTESGRAAAKARYFSSNYREGALFAPIGVMFRADVLNKYIDYDEMLRRHLPVEDYPLQAILCQHTDFACLPDLLVTYRVYKESASFISFDHPKFMEYYRGLAETRRYLNELFPQDACVTEAMLQEQLFYKEFLLNVHRRDYRAAKDLVSKSSYLTFLEKGDEGCCSSRLRQARRFTRTWLHFMAFHLYKEYQYNKQYKSL